MKRFTFQEILGIVTPFIAVGFFLYMSASGEERYIDSPFIVGAIALLSATIIAALFGLIGAIVAGVALTSIAAISDEPILSAASLPYTMPALAAWFGVGAVMIRRAMLRWQRRKHLEVGQEIERLRAKNDEMQRLLAISGNADSLALSADVWQDQLQHLAASAEALMIDVPAETRAGEAFKAFAKRIQGFRKTLDSVSRMVESSGMSVAREVPLTGLAQEAIAEVDEFARALGIEIEAILQDDGVPCVVDEDLFRQGVANILRNAIEATGRAGKVTIEVHSDYRNGRAMVEISDRGPGMPADVLAQVFKPFFTTRRDRLGLGLTVAREVVKRAGGSIALSANEPRGMIVRIRLPIRRTQVVKEKPTEEVDTPLDQVKAALQMKKAKDAKPASSADVEAEVDAKVVSEVVSRVVTEANS